MAKWIKVKPTSGSIGIVQELVNAEMIRGVRTTSNNEVLVKVGNTWRVAHSAEENTVEYGKLLQALELGDSA